MTTAPTTVASSTGVNAARISEMTCPHCEGIGWFSAPAIDGGPVRCTECMGSGASTRREGDAGFDVSDGMCQFCGWPEDDCECYESDDEYGCGDDEEDYFPDDYSDPEWCPWAPPGWYGAHTKRRWKRAWDADPLSRMSPGTMAAIAREQSKHGTPLGGYPKQRRANQRRKMQAERKHRRAWRCPECGKRGGPTLESCNCNPF